MAIRQDLACLHGENVTVNVTVYRQGSTSALDISGFALSFIVRATSDTSGTALITKTTGNGGVTITSGTAGQCRVTLSTADTASLTPGTEYWYSLARTDSGSEAVFSYGTFTVGANTNF